MLIGIDASRAIRPILTGTEHYSREVIAALLHRPSANRYRLYFDREPGAVFPRSTGVEESVIPLRRGWTHLRLGGELRRHPPDVLFIPSHVIPFACPVPAVVTIHDVGYLWHRSAYTPSAWLMLHLGTLLNARAARVIVADSHATASDLISCFGIPKARIRVAHLAGPPAQPGLAERTVPDGYGIPERYFIFVGTLQPRKNLGRLLRAFAELRRWVSGPLALVLAGQPGPGARELRDLATKLGLADHVIWTGYVTAEERQALVLGATAFIYPSLYEGFGMPVLEAMAWGCPVIASSSSSLPEVVGDAGLLVDPYDEAALGHAMSRLLDDRALRDQLIARGWARAATFTWDRCAAVVADAIDDAVGR